MKKKAKVLLVDDDPVGVAIATEVLEGLGYAICGVACSAEECLRQVEAVKPQLVLMDIRLDGSVSGIEAARTVRKKYHLPVVFLTAHGDTETLLQARSAKPYGYVCKPFNRRDLAIALEIALQRHEAEKDELRRERSYLTILKSITDAVIVTDSENRVQFMNGAAEEYSGLNLGQAKGADLKDVFVLSVPDLKKGGRTKGLAIGAGVFKRCGIKSVFNDSMLHSAPGQDYFVEYTAAPLCEDNGEITGGVLIFRDISARKKAEQEMQRTLAMLRTAMSGSIQAMAMTVETRDPYTAGHQRRVTDLARAIAATMQLPLDVQDGIRMAGVIHDLGKISVPAEILSKPGRLSEIEFSLIKTHPQVGYDILKTIDFPWPVADIVYQHHEKLDGSGYPNRLGGDEILLESRIIAVADVVEAMASHRPYRASLGLETALDEVIRNKGAMYDAHVVDACMHVVREKGFLFN
jgi:PAS domain S-box-containing protein